MATTLGTTRVHRLTPFDMASYGGWKAEMTLEDGDPPAVGSTPSLTVGTLVLRGGTVTRSELSAPAKPHVVLVGGAGWLKLIATPLSWHEDTGVRLRTVLADLATAAGQTIEQPTDRDIGEHYEVIAARDGDPVRYADALDDLAEEGLVGRWRVDPDGVTRFGPRPGVEVTVRATVLGRDGGPGYTRLGIDDPLPFLPGNRLSGAPIARLKVTESSGTLEAQTWTVAPAAAPSERASIRRMVERRLQEYVRTYVVANVREDGRLDLVPPEDSPHLPEMAAVPVWTLGGATVTPAENAEVLVLFRDRRRSRPVAVAFAPGVPDRLLLDGDEVVLAEGTQPVGRGGAILTIQQTAPGVIALSVLDPDGNLNVWSIAGTALTVTNPIPYVASFVIDEGRAEVLV